MKLADAVAQYVEHKQAMGVRFRTERRTLKSFCHGLGDTDLAQIGPDTVRSFLAGAGPVTRFWQRKHEVLLGFYRFVVARGYVTDSPLPRTVPKPSQQFVPYIFSLAELKRLLAATESCERSRGAMSAATCRTLLLLLYGTGLRIGEALSLTLADVDLEAALLKVRESKFYKTRLVPIGPDLQVALSQYLARRPDHPDADARLIVSRTGTAVSRAAAEGAFRRLRHHAGVLRHDDARYQPRLHDLRHNSGSRIIPGAASRSAARSSVAVG
jgi:site-specific recombinase XerD